MPEMREPELVNHVAGAGAAAAAAGEQPSVSTHRLKEAVKTHLEQQERTLRR